MIDWRGFRRRLKEFSDGDHRGTSPETFATWFCSLYDTYMRLGGDFLTLGPVLTANVPLMQNVLLASMYGGFSETRPYRYNWMITCGDAVRAYWTGAVLTPVPFPGGITISNVVTNPGLFPTTNIYEAYSVDPFLDTLISNMQIHLSTLQGLIIAQVGPVTSPFTWVGYQ